MRFVKLTEIDAIKPFNCGDEDLNNTEYSACRFITVDAYRSALSFYYKNGFLPLLKEVPEDALTVPLYYDLTQE